MERPGQVTITINKFIQEKLATWLQDGEDKEFTLTYRGFPHLIIKKEDK